MKVAPQEILNLFETDFSYSAWYDIVAPLSHEEKFNLLIAINPKLKNAEGQSVNLLFKLLCENENIALNFLSIVNHPTFKIDIYLALDYF